MIIAVALLLGSAQTPAPDQTITVTGTRYTREQARDRAAQFVDRMGIGAGDRPVARWGDAVCPNVQGLEERLAERVELRMRAAAQAAGIPVAGAGCTTNIVVHFTGDAGPVMRRFAHRAPRYLEDVPAAARVALFEGRAPIRWVYASETRQVHGTRATEGGVTWATIDGGQGGSAFGTIPTIMNYSSSMVSTQTARVITGAAVVVDANLASGRLLDSVADYVAFVAFAEIRPNDPAPEESILTLFERGGSQALTGWDNAFLTALYRIPLDRMGRRHRGMLVSELVDAARGSGRATP